MASTKGLSWNMSWTSENSNSTNWMNRPVLTKSGLAERDRIVLEACRERGIPVAVTMAGGYANEVGDTVDVHFQSIRRAAALLKSTAHRSKETPLT